MKLRNYVLGGMLLLPLAAVAQDEINYTYIEGGYTNLDLDDVDVDGDGFFLGGSAAIHDNWHIVLDYADTDLDELGVNFDTSLLTAAIGYNVPVADTADFVARLGYKRVDVDNFGDDSGFQVEGGFRAQMASQLEGTALIRYWDVDDFDNTSLVLQGLWEFNEQWSGLVEGDFGNEVTSFRLGARLNF